MRCTSFLAKGGWISRHKSRHFSSAKKALPISNGVLQNLQQWHLFKKGKIKGGMRCYFSALLTFNSNHFVAFSLYFLVENCNEKVVCLQNLLPAWQKEAVSNELSTTPETQ